VPAGVVGGDSGACREPRGRIGVVAFAANSSGMRIRLFGVDREDAAGGNDGSPDIRGDYRKVARAGFRTAEAALGMDVFPVAARYSAERGRRAGRVFAGRECRTVERDWRVGRIRWFSA
jgi:endonuclease YncB( thermonuclease family)